MKINAYLQFKNFYGSKGSCLIGCRIMLSNNTASIWLLTKKGILDWIDIAENLGIPSRYIRAMTKQVLESAMIGKNSLVEQAVREYQYNFSDTADVALFIERLLRKVSVEEIHREGQLEE